MYGKKCMEKNPGGQNFGNEGEGRFREILSCPPPPKMHVAPQMPPQIPRPGAATEKDQEFRRNETCCCKFMSLIIIISI